MSKDFTLPSRIGVLLALLMACSGWAHAQWTKVNNPPSGTNPSTCLLLTDGSVMCQANEVSQSWLKLTPDINGSYENGSWTSFTDLPQGTDTSNVAGVTCAPCQYAPRYYASAVLKDGRVVVIGGEDNSNGRSETDIGFLFDPTGNGGLGSWSAQITEPFGTGNVGDSQSVVLANGTMLIANLNNGNVASFDPSTLTFTALNPSGKLDRNNEEGWTILPDGRVLAVDASRSNIFEIYDPSSNTWGSSGTTAGITLADVGGNCNSAELGPAVLRPDGTIIQFSGNPSGQNAVFTIATSTFAAGPTFPNPNETVADGPASLLVNGNVLVQASPACVQTSPGVFSTFNAPSHYYEFDGTNLNDVTPSSPGSNGPNAPVQASFFGRMVVLPSGQTLVTHRGDATDVWTYTPTGGPDNAWRPTITSAPAVVGPGDSYTISGSQFNGFSQGAAYGDDAQMATNFPLVRITNTGSGHVFYARTHDHSNMGVEAVGAVDIRSTNFDVPSSVELGASTLEVVTNGIPSQPFSINVEPATSLSITGATTAEFDDPVTVQAQLTSGGPVAGKTVNFVLGAVSCSGVTNGSGFASCSITPNQPAGTLTLTASFASDSSFAGSSASVPFTVTKEETALAFTAASATTGDFDDPATFQVRLSTDGGADPVAGRTVTIALGSLTCLATTDAAGLATCTITPNQPAGAVSLTATFAVDAFYQASAAATTFTVTKEETTLKFAVSSPTAIANGHPATFSAVLKEDGITPISGRSVSITLGAQSCTGVTDLTGTATCTIVVSQPLGPGTVAANFAGDPFYLPSADSEPVIVFAFLDRGSMVIGNLNSATGSTVEFWGSQWTSANSLSGGPAPNALKGFVDVAPQSCGGTWSANPATSSGPPATVPSYMGVIVSSSANQSGSIITGNVPAIVVVKTNPGYGPAPGQTGTGTVVAVFCH